MTESRHVTKKPEKKPERIEVKDGNIIVPIYKFSDGRFCVDTMLGKKRKRITRASLDEAKTEARKLIAQIKSGRSDEVLLTISEAEDYRVAKNILAPYGLSLVTAAEHLVCGQRTRNNRERKG